jgi:hypothetical protein
MTSRLRQRARPAVGPLLLASVGLVAAACGGCGRTPRAFEPAAAQRPQGAVVVVPTADGPVEVSVELALTPAERDLGLMHRTELAADAGMLFVFPSSEPRTFWMRSTLIPLDIAFLDADGTIQNVARGEPFVERPGYHSLRPARMVLELNAGWFAAHGVAAGAVVQVPAPILELPKD